ncbi:right-handed parallel beta-helix repeat-containing protein [Klebsiella pneumoniae]|uniref:right-handed parallel beta-helix repeat-containing protein n=1 Tax=Klebsiella pneumoniae TaxID=573 RepID=UPI002658F3C2|nr:right-handed parallel beta-helix repeat-containing protein [Klebsiella pneumoniae]WKG97758.1 right-handed parallel beta-helix repeat-containing protein [Klebsiella pneumoniae]WKH06800.1 right-handed parallel beta-helix repeat-containing protein [Klebsiella pneumoniae]
MTVSTEVDHNDYTGNGVTTSFPYTFRIFKKSDLTVQVADLNDNIAVLTLDTDYSVMGAGSYSGGSVVLPSPLANGWKISISRSLPATQETDLRNQGKFFAEVHEDAFDKLTMLIQQSFSFLRLALRKPSFIANFYDALGNQIRNLKDPVNQQDAATKNYVDNSVSESIEHSEDLFSRTLRVPESSVPMYANANLRSNMLVGCNNVGSFVPIAAQTDTADLAIKLSGTDGAALIGGLSFITPEMHGALGGTNDDRVYIQSAIDEAHANYLSGVGPTNVLIGGHHTVTLNPDSTLIPGEVAAGRGALCMRSGVTLMGGGSITLDGNFTGSASGAIITNWEGAADNCKIQGITLNGSRGTAAGTGITCINIVDSDNVTIDNVKAIDSTSGGIYLRRANNTVYGCSNSRIINCYVHNVGYIGIQCERPNGMTITGCAVTSCGDNGIDIFGNVTDETGQGVAEDVVVSNNTIRDVSVGVFIESCGNVAISSCRISGFSNSGVFFNRINTAAYNCSVIGCTITGANITSSQGIRWKNAVGYTRVYSNTLKNCIDSFVTTGGMIYVDIGVNNHENIGRSFLYVPKTSNGCVYTRMAQQVYNGVQTDGIPYNTTPRGWPSANNTRYYRTSFVAPYMMYSATTGEDNFIRATGTLPSNSGWGPAYSLYNSIVAGETVIAMWSSLLSAGEYMLINGNYYLVFSVASSYAVVRKWDVSSQGYIAGDYTSYLNSAYAYSIFRAAWGTL